MRRVSLSAIACLAAILLATAGAWADAAQITLSRSSNNSILFTDTNAGMTVTFTTNCGHANCIAGNALLDFGTSTITGKYWAWIVGNPLPLSGGSGGDYTINQGSTAVYLEVKLGPNGNGSQGVFISDVNLTEMTGGQSPTATFDGTFVPTTSTGNFTAPFPLNTSGQISFTVDLSGNSGLQGLHINQSMGARLSSGEVDSPVPEPASLALLGTGVLSLAGFMRRKLR